MSAGAPTFAVLADCVWLAAAAMAVGIIVYGIARSRGALTDSGRVWVAPYELPDVIMGGLLIYLMTSAIMTGTGAKDTTAAQEPLTVGGIALSIIVSLGLTMLVMAYLRWVRGLDPAELFGLTQLRARKALLFAAVCLVPVIIIVGGTGYVMEQALTGLWPDLAPQSTVTALLTTDDTLVRTLMIIAAVLIAPLTEELLYRGFIYGVCKRFTDAPYAAVVSALLFAVVHLHVATFVPLFVLALILTWLYERTGSLLVPMLLHAGFNAVMIAMIFWQGTAK